MSKRLKWRCLPFRAVQRLRPLALRSFSWWPAGDEPMHAQEHRLGAYNSPRDSSFDRLARIYVGKMSESGYPVAWLHGRSAVCGMFYYLTGSSIGISRRNEMTGE